MAVWRYSGHLMGIPETILFRDADEALRLYDIGHHVRAYVPKLNRSLWHTLWSTQLR